MVSGQCVEPSMMQLHEIKLIILTKFTGSLDIGPVDVK